MRSVSFLASRPASGLVLVLATLLGAALPLHAQPVSPSTDTPPVTTVSLLRQLSLRVDALQVRSDLLTPGGDAANSGIAVIGEAKAVLPAGGSQYRIVVDGWGLICSALSQDFDFARVQIVLDDVEMGVRVTRHARADVEAIVTPWHCARYNGYAPLNSGIRALIDPRALGRGPDGDHWHDVKIRVYDLFGRIRDSQPVRVFVPDVVATDR